MSTEQGTREVPILAERYELGERLGHGGMAEVRAALDVRLARAVAVKRLRADLSEQPKARDRFEAEARMAAGLSHPNIVTVFDSGEDDGVPFLVMERLPGRTLAHEIADGPLDLARAVEITCAVLAALAAAHRAGIVHRDVKPGNVLLTDDGLPKVADFGIAKIAEDYVGNATVTGELFATPAYLAPERLAGQPATPSSDLYAVGVLLYEALSGEKPFSGGTPIAVLDAVKRGDAAPLSEVRPGFPESLYAVVTRAMAVDPAERFSSADDMAAALDAVPVLDAAPVPDAAAVPEDRTVPMTTIEPTATLTMRPPRRERPGRERSRRERAPREASPRAPSRDRRRWIAAVLGVMLLGAAAVGVVVSRDDGSPSVNQLPATTAAVPVSQPTSTPGPLPRPLDRAIDQLEESVSR